jgi:hypothetical protein
MRSAPSTQRSPTATETEALVRVFARHRRARRHAEALAKHLDAVGQPAEASAARTIVDMLDGRAWTR